MFKLYKRLLIAAILSFSTSLVCMEEKEGEKIDPACRDSVVEECADETTTSEKQNEYNGWEGESIPLPTNLDSLIINQLAGAFGKELDPEEASRIAKFLKPHMKTLAVVALCRLSEQRVVNRRLVDQLIGLAKRKTLTSVLGLLNSRDRNQYVMQEVQKKVWGAPRTDNSIPVEQDQEEEQLFDTSNLSVLSVAALGYLSNMPNPDLERVKMFIAQANPHDLEIALAINSYSNKDVELLMIEAVLNNGLAQVEELYLSKEIYGQDMAGVRKELKDLKEQLIKFDGDAKKRLSIKLNFLRAAAVHAGISALGYATALTAMYFKLNGFVGFPLFFGGLGTAATGVIGVPIWILLALW